MWQYQNTDELYHHGVLGMKWGVRRYQNADGSLTSIGKKRQQRENVGKKPNKIRQADPNRWVKEDMQRSKHLLDNSTTLLRELNNAHNNSLPKKMKRKQQLDLSKMTDKEMRDKINRAYLEKQYNDVFNPKQVSTGRKIVKTLLEGGASALVVTSSALSVALAIKELRGA